MYFKTRILYILFTSFLVAALSGCKDPVKFSSSSRGEAVSLYFAITSPRANASAKDGLTVGGTCLNGADVTLSGVGNTRSFTTPCTNKFFSAYVQFTSGDGIKNIVATQVDPILKNLLSDNRDFVRDNGAPVIKITGPAANTQTSSALTVVGSCENDLTVVLSGSGLSTSYSGGCASGIFSIPVVLASPDGVKNIVATQTDGAGNTGTDNRSFVLNTVPPTIRITGPAANSIFANGLTLVGTCQTGLPIAVSGTGIASTSNISCSAAGTFSSAMTFSSGDGVKNIIVSQTDTLGNTGSDNRDFLRDTTPPAIQITSPAANTLGQTSMAISGSCEAGLAVNISGTGASGTSTTSCTGGAFSTTVNFSNGDGVKNIIASQTDVAGNSASDNRNFLKDTIAPIIKITGPAANSTTNNLLTLVGSCEAGLNVAITGAGLASPVNTTCASSGTFSAGILLAGNDGTKNVVASQTDAAGNTGSDNRNFIKDTSGPVITITGPASGVTASTGVTVVGSCETGITVTLSGTGINSPVTAACNNSAFSSAIIFSSGDGAKNIIATQTDASGNVGSDNRSFIKDSTAPVIQITSPAVNTQALASVQLAGSCETGIPVIVSGSGSLSNITTSCLSGAFNVAVTFSNGDGVKNIIVTQTDAAGNSGTDNRNFLKNNVGPVVTITGPAPGTSSQNGVTLVGTCQAGLDLTISGTGNTSASTMACSTGSFSVPVTFTGGDGAKNITVAQINTLGLTGSDNRNFNKDTTAPLITITSPAANSYVSNSGTISGSCETGLQVTVGGSGAAASVVTSCNAGGFNAAITFTSGDGTKNITAAQTDAAGNSASDNRNFVKDGTAPLITITSPAANTIAQTGLTVGGNCENGLAVSLAGAGINSVSTACNGGTFSAAVTFTAGDGNKNVTASQTDGAGNTGSDSRIFIKDTTAPLITITSPAVNTSASNGVTVGGTCQTGLIVSLSGTGISSATTTNCNGGTFSAAITFSAGDGVKNIIASQTDIAGNTGSDNRNFNKDTAAPAILITGPAAGSTVGGSVTVTGTCETGLTVALSGAGLASSATASCTAGNFSASVNLSSGDGSKNVTASQTDGAGNTGSDNRSFNKDTTAPLIAITSPVNGSTVLGSANISGTCETGLTVTLSGTGLASAVSTGCAGGVFSSAVNFSNVDGVKNVIASQTDGANNKGSDTKNYIKDTATPLIAITSPGANTSWQNAVTLTGTCENGLTVSISGTGISSAATATCAGGVFTSPVTFSSGDGIKNIVVAQTDSVGNTGSDNRSFVKDSTAPLIAITSPAAGTSAIGGLTISGNCEAGLAVNISGTGVSASSNTSCPTGTFTSNITFSAGAGVKNVIVSQTDAANNSGSDNRDFQNTLPVTNGHELFTQGTPNNKVDILIIDDNSASMENMQANLGLRFGNFITGLSGLDWQMGFTTTDVSNGTWGIQGSLLPLSGALGNILTPATANPAAVFNNTISRPETVNCLARGACPAGNSQPLAAGMLAMGKANTANAGFFRDGADLAVVMLTNANEMQDGPPGATSAQQFVNYFTSLWPTKKLSVHSIIIIPGDAACLSTQKAASAFGLAYEGTIPYTLTNMTGGSTGSICDNDYSNAVDTISQRINKITDSVQLSQIPNPASSVSVIFTPAQAITWTVQGSKIIFSSPPAVGSSIDVYYQY